MMDQFKILMLVLGVLCLCSACSDSANMQDMISGDKDTADADFSVEDDDSQSSGDDDGDFQESDMDVEEKPGDTDEDVDGDPDSDLASDGDEEQVDTPADGDDETESDAAESESEVEIECDSIEPFDYSCDPDDPDTCPGGVCIPVTNICVAPQVNQDKWDDCGDGVCGPCETAEGCPADCGPEPVFSGQKEYDNSTTLTVWVHGFYNKSNEEMAEMTYGESKGCGGLIGTFADYGYDAPCGESEEGSLLPNHKIKMEYYGGTPADWIPQSDIDEIEQFPYDGPMALHRYALILSKFLRHRMAISGATHLKMVCHSMGCYVTRYMIEHNLGNLASENKIVRWYTTAGVLAGARLARLYDNPDIQTIGGSIGLALNDFVIMNPDYAMDYVAYWDHKLWSGNNPMFKNMIIHHAGATDPHIDEAIGIPMLDLYNPGDLPNDGIMFTDDEYFHTQKPSGAFFTPSGQMLTSSRNFVYVDHMTLPDGETQASAIIGAAALQHSRKVKITMTEFELYNDREKDGIFDFSENGQPPAEIAFEVKVKYNPYILDTYGKDILIHNDNFDHRTPNVWEMEEGDLNTSGKLIYNGPIFDQMNSLYLSMKVLEVDWYMKAGISEYAADKHEELVSWTGQISLDQPTSVIHHMSEHARIRLDVEVFQLY